MQINTSSNSRHIRRRRSKRLSTIERAARLRVCPSPSRVEFVGSSASIWPFSASLFIDDEGGGICDCLNLGQMLKTIDSADL